LKGLFAVRGERCWSKINIALFLMRPKELEGVIVDQIGALVIQLRKQIVQNRLTAPDKVRISLCTRRRQMANAIAYHAPKTKQQARGCRQFHRGHQEKRIPHAMIINLLML
jgi:hypothetical protein